MCTPSPVTHHTVIYTSEVCRRQSRLYCGTCFYLSVHGWEKVTNSGIGSIFYLYTVTIRIKNRTGSWGQSQILYSSFEIGLKYINTRKIRFHSLGLPPDLMKINFVIMRYLENFIQICIYLSRESSYIRPFPREDSIRGTDLSISSLEKFWLLRDRFPNLPREMTQDLHKGSKI